ncbi:DUF4166 domain-containing protein [Hyalangium gracile]|uniref:DUF4166 domain-containing protein n=1 Tax=Hyalangium gracile TaxID=394092 RepID=UPI001CCA6E5D|nr:DUF4166 domain-containing protein [Hyalangium gracile]
MVATARALAPMPAPSLYAGMLGAHWAGLPPVVRRMHEEGSATGRLTVRRGGGLLSRVIGWLCRFPAAGDAVPTVLRVQREGEGQRWERSFGGHRLVTWQRECARELLGERFGPVECVFRLRPVEGGLAYEQVGALLCLGSWRLPLPRLLAPRVEAMTLEAPRGMRVHVKIGAAVLGWLLTYEGLVNPEETSP